MEGVLSEMRPGGRFADLRTQFNSALEHDRGFAAAYDKASTALAQYGDSRTAVDAIIAKSPAAGLGAKFEALDAQIGEAAGKTPSSRDGMSKLDDITKQLAKRPVREQLRRPQSASGPTARLQSLRTLWRSQRHLDTADL